MNNIFWYICFGAAAVLILLAVRFFFAKKYGKLRTGYSLACAGAATYILYFPFFFADFHLLPALIAGFINILQVISLDADYNAFYVIIRESVTPQAVAELYSFTVIALHFLLPGLSVLAAYNILMYCLSTARTFMINKSSRPLYVFSDYNNAADTLAQSIRARSKKTDILFASCEEKGKNADKLSNCVWHPENLRDISVKQKKRKDIYYFCISENEDDNLNTALYLISEYDEQDKEAQKHIHIFLFSTQPDTDTMIDSTNKGYLDIRIINVNEKAAYRMLSDYPLTSYVVNGTISLCLWGLTDVNLALLKAAAWCGQLDGVRLVLNVVGVGIGAQIDELKYSCPAFADCEYFTLHFYDCASDAEALETVAAHCTDATVLAVDAGDDINTLSIALRLRRLFYAADKTFSNAPALFARIENPEKTEMIAGLRTSVAKEERRIRYNIIPYGTDNCVYSCDTLIFDVLDYLSKNVHLVYEDIFSDGEIDVDAALSKYNLLETNKRSNVANAMHIRYRLAMLGLDYTEDADADEVDLADYLTEEKLLSLSRAEHDRWVVFHLSEGWIPASVDEVKRYQASGLSAGDHKCPMLKMHPYICPNEELKERAEQLGLPDSTVYDRELIRRIPDILHDRWNVSAKEYKIVKIKE